MELFYTEPENVSADRILLDEFEIEVLISNERHIEKIKITPTKTN